MVLSKMIIFLKYYHPTLYRILSQFRFTMRDDHPGLGPKSWVPDSNLSGFNPGDLYVNQLQSITQGICIHFNSFSTARQIPTFFTTKFKIKKKKKLDNFTQDYYKCNTVYSWEGPLHKFWQILTYVKRSLIEIYKSFLRLRVNYGNVIFGNNVALSLARIVKSFHKLQFVWGITARTTQVKKMDEKAIVETIWSH